MRMKRAAVCNLEKQKLCGKLSRFKVNRSDAKNQSSVVAFEPQKCKNSKTDATEQYLRCKHCTRAGVSFSQLCLMLFGYSSGREIQSKLHFTVRDFCDGKLELVQTIPWRWEYFIAKV